MSGDDPSCGGDEDLGREGVRAVVDRIVDGRTAVLQVDPDGDELHLPADQLPDGAVDGTWLLLDVDAEPPRVLGIDHDYTKARRDSIADRMRRLRQARRGGRFDRTD